MPFKISFFWLSLILGLVSNINCQSYSLAQNGWVSNSSSQSTVGNSLVVGEPTNQTIQSFLLFNTTSISSTVNVTSMSLNLTTCGSSCTVPNPFVVKTNSSITLFIYECQATFSESLLTFSFGTNCTNPIGSMATPTTASTSFVISLSSFHWRPGNSSFAVKLATTTLDYQTFQPRNQTSPVLTIVTSTVPTTSTSSPSTSASGSASGSGTTYIPPPYEVSSGQAEQEEWTGKAIGIYAAGLFGGLFVIFTGVILFYRIRKWLSN